MSVKNTREYRAELNKAKAQITDEELFQSEGFREYLSSVTTALTKAAGTSVRVIWSDHETAYTDGHEITLNGNSPLVKNLNREDRALALLGTGVHENGHLLYTDFTELVKFRKRPTEKIRPGGSLGGIWDAMHQHPKLSGVIASTLADMDNVIEDNYIESCLRRDFAGEVIRGLSRTDSQRYTVSMKTDMDKGFAQAVSQGLPPIVSAVQLLPFELQMRLYYGDSLLKENTAFPKETAFVNDTVEKLLPLAKEIADPSCEKPRWDLMAGAGLVLANAIVQNCKDIEEAIDKMPPPPQKGGAQSRENGSEAPKGGSSSSSEETSNNAENERSSDGSSKADKTEKNNKTEGSSKSGEEENTEEDSSQKGQDGSSSEDKSDSPPEDLDPERAQKALEEMSKRSTEDTFDIDNPALANKKPTEKSEIDAAKKASKPEDFKSMDDIVTQAAAWRVKASRAKNKEARLKKMLEEGVPEDKRYYTGMDIYDDVYYPNPTNSTFKETSLLRNQSKDALEAEYHSLIAPYAETIAECSRLLKKALHEKKIASVRKGQYYGPKINQNELWRKDSAVFMRKKEPKDTFDTVFYIRIDESGSMGGKNITNAQICAAMLHEILDKAKVAHAIVGDTASFKSIRCTGYVDFDDVSNDKHLAICQISPGESNHDEAALMFAASELIRREEKQKCIISISDGLPSAYGTGVGDTCVSFMKETIANIRKNGVSVLGVNLEPAETRIPELYGEDYTLTLTNMDDLTKELSRVVLKKLLNPQHARTFVRR